MSTEVDVPVLQHYTKRIAGDIDNDLQTVKLEQLLAAGMPNTSHGAHARLLALCGRLPQDLHHGLEGEPVGDVLAGPQGLAELGAGQVQLVQTLLVCDVRSQVTCTHRVPSARLERDREHTDYNSWVEEPRITSRKHFRTLLPHMASPIL